MTSPAQTNRIPLLERIARPRHLGVLVACLFGLAMGTAALEPVVDPDGWWIAAAGREMLATHAVPRVNLFSFVEPSRPWLMHEWLFGPPYARALQGLGPAAFVAIALLVAAVQLALVLASTVGRSRHLSVGLAFAFVAVAFFGSRFLSARPTGVSLVFPMALTWLAFGPRFGPLSLAMATWIELVWTNAHGSFPLGIAILVVAALDRREDRAWRAGAAAMAALATCLNPYGLALHRFVWRYFRGKDGIYREIHASIAEFGNICTAWGRTVGPPEVLGLFVMTVLAVLAARDPRHRLRALFCLVLLVGACFQVRHVELAGLLTCFLLVPFADEVAIRRNLPHAPTNFTKNGAAKASLVILASAYALSAVLFAVQAARRSPEQWVGDGPSVLPLLAAVPDDAHLYVPFDRAGLAIWYGVPRGVHVFYDSRNDCYSADTYRTFRAIGNAAVPAPLVLKELARTDTDAVMVENGRRLGWILSHAVDWALVQRSGPFSLYRRAAKALHPEHAPRGAGDEQDVRDSIGESVDSTAVGPGSEPASARR